MLCSEIRKKGYDVLRTEEGHKSFVLGKRKDEAILTASNAKGLRISLLEIPQNVQNSAVIFKRIGLQSVLLPKSDSQKIKLCFIHLDGHI